MMIQKKKRGWDADEVDEEHDEEERYEEPEVEDGEESEDEDEPMTLRRSQRHRNKPTVLTYDEIGGKPVLRYR